MAYITPEQLTIERMSVMGTGEFELALSDLKEAGLSQTGADYLAYYINPPYQQRVVADIAYTGEIDRLKSNYQAAIAAPLGTWVSTGEDYLVKSDANLIVQLKLKLDLLIAADAGRRHNEKFKGIAPYLYLWPFSFYDELKRTINDVPLIFAFKLNGETLDSDQGYRNYWLNNPAINWPDIPIQNLYDNTAYRDRMWDEFLRFAPDYKYFLTAIKYLIGAGKITVAQSIASVTNADVNFDSRYGQESGLMPVPLVAKSAWPKWEVDNTQNYEWFPVLDPYMGYNEVIDIKSRSEGWGRGIFTNRGQNYCTTSNDNLILSLDPNRNEPARLLDSCAGPRIWPSGKWLNAFGLGYRKAINASNMPWVRNASLMDTSDSAAIVKDFPVVNPYNPLIGKDDNMWVGGTNSRPTYDQMYFTTNNGSTYLNYSQKWAVNYQNFFGTTNAYQYLNSLELLRQAVNRETLLRFGKPILPPPSRKRSWFWKVLAFVPYIFPFLAPTLIFAKVALQLVAIAAGQIVAKAVGGVLGSVLGALTSAGINIGGSLLKIGETAATVATPTYNPQLSLSFDPSTAAAVADAGLPSVSDLGFSGLSGSAAPSVAMPTGIGFTDFSKVSRAALPLPSFGMPSIANASAMSLSPSSFSIPPSASLGSTGSFTSFYGSSSPASLGSIGDFSSFYSQPVAQSLSSFAAPFSLPSTASLGYSSIASFTNPTSSVLEYVPAGRYAGMASMSLDAAYPLIDAASGVIVPYVPSITPAYTPPSYALTTRITGAITDNADLQKFLGAGLDAAIGSYVGISPAVLNNLSTDGLMQSLAIAGSIAAPKEARLGLGAISLYQNADTLIPTSMADFKTLLPAVETAVKIALPDQSRQIGMVADVLSYAPNFSGGWSIPDLSGVIARIPEYIIEGIEETGKAIAQTPQLAVKGMEYAVRHVEEIPQIALKGVEFTATHVGPAVLEGLQETGKFVIASPQLAVKGLTYVAEKSSPIILEGLEETGKAILKTPELIFEGVGESLKFIGSGLEQVPLAISRLGMPDMSQFQFPSMQMEVPVMPPTTSQRIVTVDDGVKTVTKENIPTSTGVTGETIIHLPATLIRDTNLPLLVIGGLAVLSAAVLIRKN